MPSKNTYKRPSILIFVPFLVVPFILIPIIVACIQILTNAVDREVSNAFYSGDFLSLLMVIPSFWSNVSSFEAYFPIIVSIFIISLCLSLMTWTKKTQELNSEGSALGDVHIKRGKEARKGFLEWAGEGSAPEGYVCGCSGKDLGSYYIAPWTQSPMGILIGDTGTGKTRRIIIPCAHAAIKCGASVLITDRKGDLAGILEQGISKSGSELYVIDPSDPQASSTYDPMALAMYYGRNGDEDNATRSAEAIAATIIPENKNTQDPHWIKSARGILTAAILYIAFADIPDTQKNFPSVIRFLTEALEAQGDVAAERLKNALRELPDLHPAKKAATQLFTLAGRELGSVMSTLTVALRPFSSRGLTEIMSDNAGSPENLLLRPCCVFLRVGDTTNPFNALISLYIAQLGEFAQQYTKEGKKRANNVCLLMDEAGNLPKIENLASMYSTGRSHGLRLLTVWQETAQIEHLYGKTGKDTLMGNAALHIPLSPSSEEDKKLYSDMVGKTTRHTESHSKGQSGGRGSVSTSVSQQVDHVIHPWDWRERGNDNTIVIRSRKGATLEEAGVFEVPIRDATLTPAQKFFLLGDEAQDQKQVFEYRERRIAQEVHKPCDIYCPTWRAEDAETNTTQAANFTMDTFTDTEEAFSV